MSVSVSVSVCLSVSVARDRSLLRMFFWADDMNRKIKDYVCLNEVRLLFFVCVRELGGGESWGVGGDEGLRIS